MMKRFLGVGIALTLALVVCMTGVLAETRYVKTGNGKTLNVRMEPNTGDNVITRLDYGEAVDVNYDLGNGWTAINLPGTLDVSYVQTKFLVSKKPGKYVPSSADAALAQPATAQESFTMDQLNTVLDTGKYVTPYTVTVYPTRASGWVYVRWVPSKNSKAVEKLNGGTELRVLAELKNWYLVEDLNSGKVGYVNTSYVH